MRAVASVSRYWMVVALSVLVQLRGPVMGPLVSWSQYWVTNRSSIVLFTAVNTSITVGTEAATRVVWPMITHKKEHGFLVKGDDGAYSIHRQSLINIFMTFFASLLGGPVYFIRGGFSRFLFFLSFGTFNSLLSQGIASFFREGALSFVARRLYFDFFYNGSVKFLLFELSRGPILKRRRSFSKVTTIRGVQDLLTTCFRVAMLNQLGLKN